MNPDLSELALFVETCALQIRDRTEGTRHTVDAVDNFLLKVKGAKCAKDGALICRSFREANLRPYFNITHVSSAYWLTLWNQLEAIWSVSPARHLISVYYVNLVSTQSSSDEVLWEEVFAVELAHITKFLPIFFVLGAKDERGPTEELTDIELFCGLDPVFNHPIVERGGRIVGAYSFPNPEWSSTFIDDMIAARRSRGFISRKDLHQLRPGVPDGGFELIGHMGHCGSTLVAKVLERRRAAPILREPRDVDTILAKGEPAEVLSFVDILMSSRPCPAGLKLASGQIEHAVIVQKILRARFDRPVRLYLIERSIGAVMARTVRSNSPTLVQKVWLSLASGAREKWRGLLVSHFLSMARFIQGVKPNDDVVTLKYDSLQRDLRFTNEEIAFASDDQKATSAVSLTRGLTNIELSLEATVNAILSVEAGGGNV